MLLKGRIDVHGERQCPTPMFLQSATKLVEALREESHLMSMFLFLLIKTGVKNLSMVPLPLPYSLLYRWP